MTTDHPGLPQIIDDRGDGVVIRNMEATWQDGPTVRLTVFPQSKSVFLQIVEPGTQKTYIESVSPDDLRTLLRWIEESKR